MTHQASFRRSPFFAALLGILLSGIVSAEGEPAVVPTDEAAESTAQKSDGKQYELKYKLKRGDVLRYDVTHRASVRSTIEQDTQAAQTRTDSVKAWKITDVLKNGDIEFINIVEKVHMVNQLPEKDPTEYDSERDKTPPPGFEDAAKAIGVPLSVVRMSPQGKILRRDLKVPNGNTEEDAPVALRLPEKSVAIGDTWDDPFDIVVAIDKGSKSIQTRRHHELADVSNGVATIKVTYQVLSPIDSAIESQLVQRLMDGEVKFDIEAGRVIGQQMEVDRRILGFAGPTSSMQYIMKMEEKLLPKEAKITTATPIKKATQLTSASAKSKNTPVAKKTQPSKTKTANRPRVQQEGRTIRR